MHGYTCNLTRPKSSPLAKATPSGSTSTALIYGKKKEKKKRREKIVG